jgi:hypothetical protein
MYVFIHRTGEYAVCNICRLIPCHRHMSLSPNVITTFRVHPRRHHFDYICTFITKIYYNNGLLSIVIMIMCTVNNHIKIEQNK